MNKFGVAAIAAASMVIGLATPAAASTSQLRIVDLGTLGGTCCSQANAINDRGEVVGSSNVDGMFSATHAFLWRDGTMIDLGTLGGYSSTAADINNDGDVVGYSDLPDGSLHAVLWRDGRAIDLGTLGGRSSYAMAINDRGDVVGYSETGQGTFELHAFLWRNGTMTDLTPDAGQHSRAEDVNGRGQVVGTVTVDGMNGVPVRWKRSGMTTLSDGFGVASAINKRGQVAGYYYGGHGAFLWSRGQLVDLGTLNGAIFVQAFGINDDATVVGYTEFDAFVWQDGQMTALPTLVGPHGTVAYDINNHGQIAGYSPTTPEGFNSHAVIWTR